jgi:capsular exopolysaccharide synthesis family protein
VNPADYWKAIRRRWGDVVLAVAVALAAAWVITSVVPPGPPGTTYEATAALVQTRTGDAGAVDDLQTVAALATIGRIPERVKEAIDHEGDAQALVTMVKIDAGSTGSGIVRFTASGSSAAVATELANAFAIETRGSLIDRRIAMIADRSEALTQQLDELDAEVEALDAQLAVAPPSEQDVIQAQRDAKIRQYGALYEQYQSLTLAAQDPGALSVVRANGAVAVSAVFEAPRSRVSRMIVAGVLGVIAGIVIVLLLDRFDSRIRTRQGAEKAFGLPVLAEVPFVARWKRRDHDIVTLTEPRSTWADAYRIVGTMLTTTVRYRDSGNGSGNGDGTVDGNGDVSGSPELELHTPPKTIVVTSPGPDDGKTTAVANLAATFNARGVRTLVLSCDMRRPQVHEMLGAANALGLAEGLQRDWDPSRLTDILVSDTILENVKLVPSGQPPAEPGELLSSKKMRSVLETARHRADVVLIDTAPILTTADAVALVGQVDSVVIVARSGRTTIEAASRTSELLRRLGAPLTGVILNAAAEINVPRNYYFGRYTTGPKQARKRRRGISRLVRHSSGD